MNLYKSEQLGYILFAYPHDIDFLLCIVAAQVLPMTNKELLLALTKYYKNVIDSSAAFH